MKDESTLLEVQIELGKLMSDLSSRIDKVYDKYTIAGDIPKLPPFEQLRSDKIRYECSRVLTNCVDELNEMKLRVSLLSRELYQYQNFQPASKTDYNIAVKFRETIKDHIETLTQYRFDLDSLVRNANSKLKVLENANYYDLQ